VVCSSCGEERPAGDRFCGMCGTPLPHPPLSTAGAEGTLRLTRGPLESPSPHGRMSTAVAGLLEVLHSNTASCAHEEPRGEAQVLESAVSPVATAPPAETAEPAALSLQITQEESPVAADITPGSEPAASGPLRDFIESLDHPLDSQPEQTATAHETPARQPDVSEFLDALAHTPAEPSKSNEAPHFPWMDDVLDQIELEAARTSAARDERPRFLDLLGDLALPEVERTAPAPAVVSPSLSEAGEAPDTNTSSRVAGNAVKPAGGKRRMWLATAAALVFVALATIQWKSQIARNGKRLGERISSKIHELAAGDEGDAKNSPSATPAVSVDSNTASQVSQPGQPSKPQPENAATNASGQATALNENPAPTNVTAPANAATHVQPPPAAQDEPEVPNNTVPGAREMMRAKQAKTAASRSEWLWKATARGNPDAPLQLAELYVTGEGVPRSCEQAVVLLKTAALNNNPLACNRLASLYTTGTCVPRSPLEAYRWLSSALAADPNNQSAQHNRDLIWEQMTPEERTLVQESR
jgi:zinc-ribbon domain/Sel1 repeat